MKLLSILMMLVCIGFIFVKPSLGYSFFYEENKKFDEKLTPVLTMETVISEQAYTLDDLLSSIESFVDIPRGGVSWRVFGETGQEAYSYQDEEGTEWNGVRPKFSENLKQLDGAEVLVQGYMFPLGQEENQSTFLFGPFPISCPFHYHVTPNLIIEVHAKKTIAFSYDPINVKGKLELISKDDEYNVFYRLKDAEPVK